MHAATHLNGHAKAPTARPLLSEADWTLLCADLGLSDRELQIMQGVCSALKDEDIARKLGISPNTVRTHFERLYRKLGVKNRTQLLLRIFDAYIARQRTPWDEQPVVEFMVHRLKHACT